MPPKKTYSEETIVDALFDITDGGISMRKSSKKHGVPLTTLSNRLRGTATRNEAQESQQRLTVEQEKKIVDWIVLQERLGCAPSHSAVRGIVERILKKKGDNQPLGKKWVQGFKKRHPEIQTKKRVTQESARFEAFTPKAVN